MKQHWVLLAWFLATSLVNLLMRTKTAEEWDALAQKNARYASLARMLRSLGVDPVKLIQSVVDFVRGESQKRLEAVADDPAKPSEETPPASQDKPAEQPTDEKQNEGKDSE